ncbi:hypothetical protein TIFTF001_038457 [Ficus carica]|uniref:Uncharacterized protein n=1 Tax=Ficus carica TaxID=3494 RepID=A0AA88EBJ0_FICCA|nr:hypothetical protein TIFTF001_038457 [Ficus carica]
MIALASSPPPPLPLSLSLSSHPFGLIAAAVTRNSRRHSSRPHLRWWRSLTIEIHDAITTHHHNLILDAG